MELQRVEISRPLAQIAAAIEAMQFSQWEYLTIRGSFGDNETLNRHGAAGWELVGVTWEHDPRLTYQAIFKRRRIEH